ncbi:MAG: cytochrome c oxidase subunit II [Actinobacteria bacterium]|nr:cytochrome c oxidase subunit II [Actinomycetota bacterium]|tara:strand:+ start:47 stop:1060 length:1014 start_codon:yes stop_codon:yes gene_type:complete
MFKILNLIKRVKPLLFVFFISACIENAPMDSLSPEGPYARTIDDLFWLTFWIAVVIFIIVQGALIIAVIFFRDKEGMPEPKQIQGNHKLELLWTIIPVLILGAIAFPTVRTIFDLAKEPEGALNIELIGHQWWFEFNYPDYDITTANILVIPEGTPVRLEMWSNDVMHNFWVPKLNGKRYLVPGQKTYLNLFADNAGEYWAQCGEYCGLSHSKMRARVISLSSGDFEKWIENEQKNALKPPEGSLAAKGEEIYLNAGCTQCHVIDGIWDIQGDRIAPNLTHVASRHVLGGASFNNNKEDLTAWLANPAAIKPGTFMPNLELTEEEIDALIEYLGSLK